MARNKIKYLLVAVLTLLQVSVVRAYQAETSATVPTGVARPDSATQTRKGFIRVLEAYEVGSKHDTAEINQTIAVHVYSSEPIRKDSIFLVLDGITIEGAFSRKIENCNDTILFFKVNENVKVALKDYLSGKPFDKIHILVALSIQCGKECAANSQDFMLELKAPVRFGGVWVLITGLIIMFLVFISLRNNLLKEDTNTYYSLGRAQLFYWTLLSTVSYLVIWWKRQEIPDLNNTLLILLGISAGTTLISKSIENRNKTGMPLDPNAKSSGFIMDILSDGTGVSVNRLQNVIFNLIFGLVFLQKTFATGVFPDFDNNMLILMGISSTTYTGLKTIEVKKETSMPPPPTGDSANSTASNSVSTGPTTSSTGSI